MIDNKKLLNEIIDQLKNAELLGYINKLKIYTDNVENKFWARIYFFTRNYDNPNVMLTKVTEFRNYMKKYEDYDNFDIKVEDEPGLSNTGPSFTFFSIIIDFIS